MTTTTTMQSHAQNYLNERRRLGFRLLSTGYSIMSFAHYVDSVGHTGPVDRELMAEWARRDSTHSNNPVTWARRLKKLRPFTRYLQQFEAGTEEPDDVNFRQVGLRRAPHIYSEQEIVDLLAAARRLGPSPGLRGACYESLFGLIASTGLRVSEAVHLLDRDVDLNGGMLTIRQTKFAKSRQVPLHRSAVTALKRYQRARSLYVNVSDETPFFVSTRGQRSGCALNLRQVRRVFVGIRDELGIPNRGAHAAPRIHDLRHTFVVRRMMLWHMQGVDLDQMMLALSTYVGHAMVTNTYWYLTAVPELMAAAATKFEPFAQAAEVKNG